MKDKDLYKKLSSLKDLRSAIKEVKKTFPPTNVKITKNDAPKPSSQPQPQPVPQSEDDKLKYLGRKKLIGGIVSHLIGNGKGNSYQMDCHLERHNKGIPSITIAVMSPKGEILDQSPNYHKDMKEAIKSIVSHNIKKVWE